MLTVYHFIINLKIMETIKKVSGKSLTKFTLQKFYELKTRKSAGRSSGTSRFSFWVSSTPTCPMGKGSGKSSAT